MRKPLHAGPATAGTHRGDAAGGFGLLLGIGAAVFALTFLPFSILIGVFAAAAALDAGMTLHFVHRDKASKSDNPEKPPQPPQP